jgi:hypothetical protein
VVLLVLVPTIAFADVMNLEAGLPTEIEDAKPTEAGTWELHLPARFERDRQSKNLFSVEPRIQGGFEGGWQFSAAIPVIAGSGDKTGRGDIRFELFKTLVAQSGGMPAIAGAFGVDLPTGTDSTGFDTTYKALATWSLAGGSQLHANGVFEINAGASSQERDTRWRLLGGWSAPLSARSAFVTDLIWEQMRTGGGKSTVVEAGWRREVEKDLSFSLGAGLGLGDDSPRWRVMAGLQRLF